MFDVSDIAERAVKTAADAFIVLLPAGFVFTNAAAAAVTAKAAGLSAGAAFVSVVINAVQQWSQSRNSHVEL